MPPRAAAADTVPTGVLHAEALRVLETLPDGCAGLVYADPPFNTGRPRHGVRLSVAADPHGDRTGFAGRRYATVAHPGPGFADAFEDYLGWLRPRLEESRRILAPHGSLYLHVDPRESHYCKVLLDTVFGRECFLNEVIWAYDYGARSTRRWSPKHDVILVYVRDPRRYHFDPGAVDRVPYMAPALQAPLRAAGGKLPTDVWWHTIVPTNSRERTGYPTQKPLAVLRRIVTASSRPGDLVVDWCAGSGTTGVAAMQVDRRYLLIDSNIAAVTVMRRRLEETAAELRLGASRAGRRPSGARAGAEATGR
jgi:site-specific DNA-methyltransferase (adenine-specific)